MKIEFTFIGPDSNFAEVLKPPQPASQFMPQWYKDMPQIMPSSGDTKPGLLPQDQYVTNSTMKHCSPFLDAITAGYVYALPIDMEIRKDQEGAFFFRWKTPGDFVSSHSEDQHPGLPNPVDGDGAVMKWVFDFKIKTPSGYSAMFTHPLNRHDLPFRTFSGIVDTDEYTQSVQFPFQLLSSQIEDHLIIKKGTPLVQIIPFKREPWVAETTTQSTKQTFKDFFDFNSTIVKSYKNNFWKKKTYK